MDRIELNGDIDVGSVSASDEENGLQPRHGFVELREMVQDLQVGFTAAMAELSNIQDEDKKLHDKLEDSKHEQEVQMQDILQMVKALKEQCDNIQGQLVESNNNQRKLERQIHKMKRERNPGSERRRVQNGLADLNCQQITGNADTQEAYNGSPMLKSFIASLPMPQDMVQMEDQHSDSDESLAEVTRKSLQLTNALAQRAYGESPTLNGGNSITSSEQTSLRGHHNTSHDFASHSHNNGDKRSMSNFDLPLTRSQVQKQKVAISIVDSERNYCTTLYNLIENYSKTLKQSGSLSARDCSRIFPASLSTIYEYHCSVFGKLEARLIRWQQRDIMGDIFSKFADSSKQVGIFSQYRDYIDNFSTALRTIHKLNRNSERFRLTVTSCEHVAGGDNVSLVSQLLAPVRRIPSLVLYIKKLIKYTDGDHPDMYFLETSLKAFRLSLSLVNEAMERSLHMAVSDSGSKRSLETCSWSSHEEEQRLSTATKDSGINSNCDIGSHEELRSPARYKQRERNSLVRKPTVYAESEGLARQTDQPPRPKSMVDFIRTEEEMPTEVRRCKTPSSAMFAGESVKSSLSHSTPNLLDELPAEETLTKPRQVKVKHKVQFKTPPEEQSHRYERERGSMKRMKKRSIADTLRIIFNRRKSESTRAGEMTEEDEGLQPAPPQMFANGSIVTSQRAYAVDDTYEDENGDPYSVV